MTSFRAERAALAAAVAVFAALSTPSCSDRQADPMPADRAADSTPAAPQDAVAGLAVVTGRVPGAGEAARALVVLKPESGAALPERPMAVMDQVQLTFIPSLLFVPTGQPTEFRNSDPELHNIRVREEATKEGTFNVAIPTGETYRFTFEREGFYDVGCDIHPAMTASIIATSSPYAALAGADGTFTIPDVPPGAYVATIYIGDRRIERPLRVTGGRTEVDFSDGAAPIS